MTVRSPFHAGELAAQRRAGATDSAAAGGAFIRSAMPDQHRAFFAALPFVVAAGEGADGRFWVSILEGPEGFLSAPDPGHLRIGRALPRADPLAEGLTPGGPVGLLGIDLATRRRNRVNGRLTATPQGYVLRVEQSFGNCLQYIHARDWHRVDGPDAPAPRRTDRLDADQAARIAAADTLFIGSGNPAEGGGHDASHRGGAAGFVRVAADGALLIPDYPGNSFFNTMGNLLRDPRVGLLVVDFATGDLLQISGRARIDWTPADGHDPAARRMIHVAVDRVVDRPRALSLRWRRATAGLRLRVVAKVRETPQVTSFHLLSADGTPPGGFVAGQHLPVLLDVPGAPAPVQRSYSLSGDPAAPVWRISVKREDRGLASRVLHDRVGVGDIIDALPPQGDFGLPPGGGPLVLVSAGVGITPMLSMLHAVTAAQPQRAVSFVHATRNGSTHAFGAEVDRLAAKGGRMTRRVHYSAPDDMDRPAAFDATGRVTAEDVLSHLPDRQGDVLLCGPVRFMADLRADLEARGLPTERVHLEAFGPVKD